jgi:hypothetical protein
MRIGDKPIALGGNLAASRGPGQVIAQQLIQVPVQVDRNTRCGDFFEREINGAIAVPQQSQIGQPIRLDRAQQPPLDE